MGKQKGNRKSEKARDGGSGRTGMGRDILAVGLLALGTATAIALVTFSALDGQLIAHGVPPASNLVGPVGHHVARFLYRVLGYAALVLPVALVVTAIALFRGQSPRVTLIGSAAYAVLTASVATLSHLFLAGRGLASFPPGGFVGRLLCTRAESLFGSVGTALVVGAGAVVATIVATDVKVQKVWGATWAAIRAAWTWTTHRIGQAIDRHRAAVAEMRAEEAAERAREEELAAGAVVEAAAGDEREGRAMAGALVRERKRSRIDDEPAWATAEDDGPGPDPEAEVPRRRRRAKEEKVEEPVPTPLPVVVSAVPPEPTPEPVPLATGPDRPEIVVSQAMQERGKKKKSKDAPEFAFMQSGEVFQLPSVGLLTRHEQPKGELDEAGMQKVAEIIVSTLRQHGVDGAIRHIRPGPVVTLYEFMPVAGVKLSRIENLDKELTMALSATRIRIIAPIPGKGVVGIEVPNRDRATVYLREVIESDGFDRAAGLLPLALGKNIEGIPYCVDLQRMPHLLIAGTTGAGKSVGLNTMILSLLYRHAPDQVRMIMVDPKMTELSIYEDIPHLLLPVVTDPQKAARALQWAVDEMERRTQILADTGSKDLKSYNAKVDKLRAEGRTFDDGDDLPPKKLLVVDVAAGETEEEAQARLAREEQQPLFEDPTRPPEPGEKKPPQKLPYMVVIIDELADLMMTAPREVEISLARLAQKARATGIHLIVATQRPSTDVITGMIKNNFPARISFRLASRHDSTTIINGPGAEALLGDGDMLVLTATQPVTRVQGAFVSEEEITSVVGFLKQQGRPVYDDSILKARDGQGDSRRDEDDDDPVYDEALALVSRMEEVSVSKLQREMRLGYNKAAKIVERMEREGVVGPANGVKPRQVLIRPAGEVSAVPNL
ncbi:MAG TPA: DNA translocase FtsK [Anaeromyxobacteraceae bacterium]|nr:DNA translocase FtsK [Anaeromyxobacteraceae bacterium]